MIVWLIWGAWPCEEGDEQPAILFVASSRTTAEEWCEKQGIRTYWLDARMVDTQ